MIKEKSNCFPHINNNDGDSIILITNVITDNLIAYNYRPWILISTLPLTIYTTYKLFDCSLLQLTHLECEVNSIYLIGMGKGSINRAWYRIRAL